MSKIDFCKRGGQEGILTTKKEMYDLAILLNNRYADEVVPLPNISVSEQKEKIKDCKNSCSLNNPQYWETEVGNHGWCCVKCGTVIQWG